MGCYTEVGLGDRPEQTLKNAAHYRRTAVAAAQAIDSEDALQGLVGTLEQLQQTLSDMPRWVAGITGKLPPGIARFIMSQASLLRYTGPVGNWLADRLVATRRLTEQIQARYRQVIATVVEDLTDDEKGKIWRYLELGEDHGPRVAQAGDRLNRIRRQLYDRMAKEGINVGPDLGEKVFPHVGFDYEGMAQRGHPAREAAIDHLMEQGSIGGRRFRNRTDAAGHLDVWLQSATQSRRANFDSIFDKAPPPTGRKAGTFEIERKGMPGWTKDPVTAFQISLNDGARRLAETMTLGLNAKQARNALELMAKDNIEAARFGENLLKQTLGLSEVGITNPFLAGLYDLGLARLTFTPFMSLTEIPKLYVKSGIKPFMRGLGEFLKNPAEAVRRARWLGAVLDRHILLQQSGATNALERSFSNDLTRRMPQTFLGRTAKAVGETIARGVELVDTWTRALSVGAGDALFTDLVEKIQRNGGRADKFVISRLKEFGIEARAVERAIGDPVALEQLRNVLTKEMADQVVFTFRPTDRPEFTQSQYGMLFHQFRGFGTKQMEFMIHEVTAVYRKGWNDVAARNRTKRALHLIALTNPIMALGVNEFKEYLTGREAWSQQYADRLFDDPSFVNLVTYTAAANGFLGAFGTLSDFAQLVARGDSFDFSTYGRPAAMGALTDVAMIAKGLTMTAIEQDFEQLKKTTVDVGSLLGPVGRNVAEGAVGIEPQR